MTYDIYLLYKSDKTAQSLGAKYYHDELVGNDGYFISRHYFNEERLEVCFCVPRLLEFHADGYVITPSKKEKPQRYLHDMRALTFPV